MRKILLSLMLAGCATTAVTPVPTPSPTPAPTPSPTPVPAPVPAPVPSPTPTPAPTPTPITDSAVYPNPVKIGQKFTLQVTGPNAKAGDAVYTDKKMKITQLYTSTACSCLTTNMVLYIPGTGRTIDIQAADGTWVDSLPLTVAP